MITSVFRAINRLKQEIHCSGIIQVRVKGKTVETYQSGVIRYLAMLPLTAEFLKYDKDGTYTHKDVMVYEEVSQYPEELPLRSIVRKLDTTMYRINEMKDRNFEGNYRTYLCKKIEGTP